MQMCMWCWVPDRSKKWFYFVCVHVTVNPAWVNSLMHPPIARLVVYPLHECITSGRMEVTLHFHDCAILYSYNWQAVRSFCLEGVSTICCDGNYASASDIPKGAWHGHQKNLIFFLTVGIGMNFFGSISYMSRYLVLKSDRELQISHAST